MTISEIRERYEKETGFSRTEHINDYISWLEYNLSAEKQVQNLLMQLLKK